jgi:prevent-host-death family protein
MDEIAASDAKARFSELLDKVEKGATIVITRHGQAIARLVPDEDMRQKEVDEAISSMTARGKRVGKIKLKDLLSSVREGHKY